MAEPGRSPGSESPDPRPIDPKLRFKVKTIEMLIKSELNDSKLRLSKVGVATIAEYLRIMCEELAKRAVSQAQDDEDISISPLSLEKVLPQFLLDFL